MADHGMPLDEALDRATMRLHAEEGTADAVFAPPYHPYTEALLSAIPIADPAVRQRRVRLEGAVPSAVDAGPGCRFHSRCPRKLGTICETTEPPAQVAPS